MIASRFNQHFYSYEVTPFSDQTLIYTQNEQADYHPLYVTKSFYVSSTLFVRLKYHM